MLVVIFHTFDMHIPYLFDSSLWELTPDLKVNLLQTHALDYPKTGERWLEGRGKIASIFLPCKSV